MFSGGGFWQKIQKCLQMTSGKAVKMKIGPKMRLKSLGRLKKSVPDERLIQFWTFIPKSLLVLGVEKFPKTAWWEKIHISLDFEPQFKALKDFFTKENPYLIFWGTFTVSVLFWRWYLWVPKNAKKYHFGHFKSFTSGGFYFNLNHFWNQWPKLIPKLALNLDFDHF